MNPSLRGTELHRVVSPGDAATEAGGLFETISRHLLVEQGTIRVEEPNSALPQIISMMASITAGVSTILSSQLETRFPQPFQAPVPCWLLIYVSIVAYFLVYLIFVFYGIYYAESDGSVLSATLALMAAPAVPLHGFLWSATPGSKRWKALDPPASDGYLQQCWYRKNRVWLILSTVPLFGAAVVSGIQKQWQGMALQVAAVVVFIATSYAPRALPQARENAFGRAGRFLLVPRPGSRMDTIAWSVDLKEGKLLSPLRIDMTGVNAYLEVEKQMLGPNGNYCDDETTSQRPRMQYYGALTEKYPSEKLGWMTRQLWKTLEASKLKATMSDAGSVAMMYCLCERMAYVAFRPGSLEDRKLAMTMSFVVCRSDLDQPKGSARQTAADALMKEWRDLGVELVRSSSWENAYRCAGETNEVDKPVPSAAEILSDENLSDQNKRDTVEGIGATLYFLRLLFGHLGESEMKKIEDGLPYYHNRIKNDMLGMGSIPVVCSGVIGSMARNSMIGRIDGNGWGLDGKTLQWGGGGYALLDQSYARNAALNYVGQLSIIVVKSVLEG